jgi:hypothetical protein
MAIISRKDNPRLLLAIKEFEETTAFLFDWRATRDWQDNTDIL